MSSSNRPQMTTMNGKRPSTLPPRHHQQNQQPQQNREQSEPSSQHSDLIKFICNSWNSVQNEYHDNYQYGNSSNNKNGPIYFQPGEPNPRLKNFQPFDLETLLKKNTQNAQNATKNTNTSS